MAIQIQILILILTKMLTHFQIQILTRKVMDKKLNHKQTLHFIKMTPKDLIWGKGLAN